MQLIEYFKRVEKKSIRRVLQDREGNTWGLVGTNLQQERVWVVKLLKEYRLEWSCKHYFVTLDEWKHLLESGEWKDIKRQ